MSEITRSQSAFVPVLNVSIQNEQVDRFNENSPLINQTQGRSRLDIILMIFLGSVFLTGACVGVYLLIAEDAAPSFRKFSLVRRDLWQEELPIETSPLLTSSPIRNLIFLQSGTSGCKGQLQCFKLLKQLHRNHSSVLNQSDILYNFAIDDDGVVYECRGWTSISSNYEALTVAFLGKFDQGMPKAPQIKAALLFIDVAIAENNLDPCFQLQQSDVNNVDMVNFVKKKKWIGC